MEENRVEELVVEAAPEVQEAPVSTPTQEVAEQETAAAGKFNMETVKTYAVKAWEAVKSFAKTVWTTKLYKMIALGVAAALVLVCVLCIIGGATGPKAMAKKAATASFTGDLAKLHKLYAYDNYACELGDTDEDDYLEMLGNYMDEEFDSWEDFEDYMKETTQENLEEECGKYKVTGEVTKVKDISKKNMKKELGESALEAMDEYADFDIDDVKDFKAVTVKMRAEGKDGKEKATITVYMAKLGMMNWKVLDIG